MPSLFSSSFYIDHLTYVNSLLSCYSLSHFFRLLCCHFLSLFFYIDRVACSMILLSCLSLLFLSFFLLFILPFLSFTFFFYNITRVSDNYCQLPFSLVLLFSVFLCLSSVRLLHHCYFQTGECTELSFSFFLAIVIMFSF